MSKVLLVDDEELIRRVIKIVLEAEGHQVIEAGNGQTAMSGLESDSPDVVVLDLMMPGENGIEICRRIKAARPDARVLVLTSLPEAEARSEASEAGADDFMVKPFSALDVIKRVGSLAAK